MCEIPGDVGGERRREQLIETWKLFAKASANEKKWMHERLNWLLVSQPVLFGAIQLAVRPENCSASTGASRLVCSAVAELTPVAAGVGLAISVLVVLNVLAASRKHWQWTNAQAQLANAIGARVLTPPFVADVPFGNMPNWPARVSSIVPPLVGSTFVVLWAAYFWLS
jgi:hypothetical protein